MLYVHGIFKLNYLLIEFVISNLNLILFCIPEIFKTNVQDRVLSTKFYLNLCSHVVNLQRLLCSQKAGVKFRIKAFWYNIY